MTEDHGAPYPAPSGAAEVTRWKIATAVAAILGLVLAGTVYVVMNRQLAEQSERIDELERRSAEAADGGGGSGLGDLLGDLLGDFDERLMECLAPGDGLGLNLGEGSIPNGDLETQVNAIVEIIEQERGLPAAGELDVEFVTMAEVQRRAVEVNTEYLDRDRADIDARTLALLGAIEPGLDLAQTQLDALDAGVAGFYDPDTGELVIGSESMDAMGAFITAHELVHALTDAELGLPDLEGLAEDNGSDAAFAALAAIEGDASLYSQRFVGEHLPFDQLLELEADSADAMDELDGLPHFVVRNLEFPYVEGMTFTCDVFLDGGWEAVDGTYRHPPTTSAQVLFPDRYRDEETAADVPRPSGPTGWQLLHTDTFGAADLLFLLEAPGDDDSAALSNPLDRAAAWAGGEISTWADGDETAVAVVLADRGGATPLCDTIAEFYAAAFPDARETAEGTFESTTQAAVVACDGTEVALGIGPDVEIAAAAIG